MKNISEEIEAKLTVKNSIEKVVAYPLDYPQLNPIYESVLVAMRPIVYDILITTAYYSDWGYSGRVCR